MQGFVVQPGGLRCGGTGRLAVGCRNRRDIWRLVPRASVNDDPLVQTGAGEGKVVFGSLEADDFRHPLDTVATKMMSRILGVDILVRSLLSPAVEQALFLENISTGVLVGPKQLPKIHDQLLEACEVLRITNIPELYIKQNPLPNAYTLAINGRKPFIVVHTSLVELLTPEELQAVIAHELGHLKCEHGVWLTLANLIMLFSNAILGDYANVLLENMRSNVLRWLRSAELSCDRAALLVAQDPKIVISMMMKLAGGSTKLSKELNVEEYMKQAQMYEKATSTQLGSMLRRSQTDYLTHPLPILRVVEIEKFAESGKYRKLLREGRKANLNG
uniref:Peptidase M48 domain-containing protein n=1 Tax=Rhodosorus marinus TaxID=101924 RepID=A0A7S2ZQ93_9RHOD|mmetsp:Transcript_25078/g.98929  ORF Transcript_25078/g.98929 Transcript_25078/m.98929 type:complete len:331 (+) Transcript_25078:194-1186(+)